MNAGKASSFTEKGGCRGITQIHRSPSRPRPSVRPTAILINIHEHLIKGLIKASRQQLTSDHEPACMCHCIFFGINPRVSKYHAFSHHRATPFSILKLCQAINTTLTPAITAWLFTRVFFLKVHNYMENYSVAHGIDNLENYPENSLKFGICSITWL